MLNIKMSTKGVPVFAFSLPGSAARPPLATPLLASQWNVKEGANA